MNYTESIAHNVKCWKNDISSIDEKINFLKGKKEALAGTVECLEIIAAEQTEKPSSRRIYIAGKVTGEDPLKCTEKFAKAKQEIEALGFEAVNPLEVVGTWDISWENAMKKCIAVLMQCDAMYLLPDATKSKGANLETELSAQLGITMYEDMDTLQMVVENNNL